MGKTGEVPARVRGSGRSFGYRVARTAVTNLLASGAGAVAGLVLARALGAADRGRYAGAQSWFVVALVVGEIGLPAAVAYHVSRGKPLARAYTRHAAGLVFVGGLGTATAGLALSRYLAQGDDALRAAYTAVFVFVPVALVLGVSTFTLQGLSNRSWNLARVVQPLTYLALVLAAAASGLASLPVAVAALCLSVVIQGGVSFALYRGITEPSTKLAPEARRSLIKYGGRNFASNLPSIVNMRIDQLALSLVVPMAALGQYAVAVSLSSLILPAMLAFGHVLLPELAAQTKGTPQTKGFVWRALGATIALGAALSVVTVLGAYLLVGPLLGHSYDAVPHLVTILALSSVLASLSLVLADVLRGLGLPGKASISQSLGVASTAVLIIPVANAAGTAGAAWVMVGSACAVLVASVILVQRALNSKNGASEQ